LLSSNHHGNSVQFAELHCCEGFVVDSRCEAFSLPCLLQRVETASRLCVHSCLWHCSVIFEEGHGTLVLFLLHP
jgi:hypothetical protein